MYEKISEEETRQEKVKKVKNKILSEIDNRICSYKKLFAINEKTTEEDYNFFISENFALLELKKYLKKDNCFMSYEAKYLDKDIVVYVVSEKTLNVWMQKDYNFMMAMAQLRREKRDQMIEDEIEASKCKTRYYK